jgi:predicted Rossmann fold flavoprotein
VQIKTAFDGITALKGVRANCHITILHDDKTYAEDTGEIQFTDYGISGPVVFQISRDVCYGTGSWAAKIDFLPHIAENELFAALCRRRNTDLNAEDLLTGILHNRLGKVLIRCAGLRDQKRIAELTDEQLRWVCQAVKSFTLTLTEPMGMDCAQVTAGGVLTCDFDDRTMESKLQPGLFACGEVLDIDGDCGGYTSNGRGAPVVWQVLAQERKAYDPYTRNPNAHRAQCGAAVL